jgi:ABC-type oligopeptide transport system substrate-binding subunit
VFALEIDPWRNDMKLIVGCAALAGALVLAACSPKTETATNTSSEVTAADNSLEGNAADLNESAVSNSL